MTMYGYARVSSKDQNLNRQLDALSAVGVSGESVFVDHLSGRNFDRPGYRSLVERLQPGDVLVVKSIDRLGRNYDEILGQWRLLTKQRSIDIVVLDMPLLDTRSTSGHGVTGKLIADIVLELLSYVALAVPEEFDAVHRMWEDGSLNSRQAAESLGVSHTTFLKWVKQRPVDVTISHKSMRSWQESHRLPIPILGVGK